MRITRREFLQYCMASAAALGLSQADILKLKEVLAAQTCPPGAPPSTPVIWLSGQSCSGCVTSILNRVVDVTGGYYDENVLNALYGTPIGGVVPDPTELAELQIVNDVADLLVGDAVGALTGVPRALGWAGFNAGYVTNTWNTTVMASMGELEVPYLEYIVNNQDFVLIVEGAVPLNWGGKGCLVFDNYPDPLNPATGIIKNLPGSATNPPVTWGPANGIRSVTMWEALIWMASKPNCLFVECVGTCSSFGGIPAGRRNRTQATSVEQIFIYEGISLSKLVNVPGCPAHPDWMIYPVAYALTHALSLPTLDSDHRPIAIYSAPNCPTCPNGPVPGVTNASELGDKGCLINFGCKGSQVSADCPVRKWNRFDDGTNNNWCVGAQPGVNPAATPGIADARHPCQGCVERNFPDGMSPFYGDMDVP